ncbi:glycerophosphodiester phosphodiesterase [Spelaeicoccus albus]|uniref:Glycerophosphoryl diester phosphodiesterase n=1 Tax=Spelaeicoccus albus TaxID=1280376 RepID=A0A7Z0D1L1_9MICO|nr:glycerophosphodiester phosphodiesterase [Spelaeicoccus albus]NYI66447.1 glycerophosphoryl diester phosphodiesterase [Spelaeicoccus albus]
MSEIVTRRVALGAALTAAGGLLVACSEDRRDVTPTQSTGLADKLQPPFFIAHRGGAARYPEHSMEAYDADAKAGFPIEQDVQLLKDGTPVIIHDSTADRTMTGHGKVKDLTLAQWEKMRIKPIKPGGKPVKPLQLKEVLDKFGGKHLLVPEIKSKDAKNALIESIVKRDLQRDVIVQSFYYEAAVAAAAKDIPTLWLSSDAPSDDKFKAAKSDGITYWGYDESLPPDAVKRAVHAGLKPVAWTVNTVGDARRQFKAGAVGVFTNNPWKLSKAHYG